MQVATTSIEVVDHMSLAMKMLSGKIQLKFLLCISLFYFLFFAFLLQDFFILSGTGQNKTQAAQTRNCRRRGNGLPQSCTINFHRHLFCLTFCFFLFLFSIFFNDHCISLFFLKKKERKALSSCYLIRERTAISSSHGSSEQ